MSDFFCSTLFDGTHLLQDVRFTVHDGYISTLTANAQAGNAEQLTGLVCPGYIDVQVNGGGGEQFNHNPTAACLAQMAKAHLAHGTTSLLPTVITDDIAIMQQAADAVAAAHRQQPGCFVGIHFEGPHLSSAKKGMHSARHLRAISAPEMALFTRKDLGQVMVTVAPEQVSPSQIAELVGQNVIVSVGHTNASFEQCNEAFSAGATGATHLFNAMSGLSSREPGVVGSALYNEHIYCGLIIDNAHVHPASATLAIRLKGPQHIMLITDAMAPAASDTDHFMYQGETVFKQNGTLNLADGTLAGSVLTMDEAVMNTHQLAGISREHALQMATATPATFLGLSNIGRLAPGYIGNFLTLDDTLKITGRWHNGQAA